MNPPEPPIIPDWKWGTAEGSRDLDRLLDRRLSFREKLEWLEEAETLSLRFQAIRQKTATREAEMGSSPPQIPPPPPCVDPLLPLRPSSLS